MSDSIFTVQSLFCILYSKLCEYSLIQLIIQVFKDNFVVFSNNYTVKYCKKFFLKHIFSFFILNICLHELDIMIYSSLIPQFNRSLTGRFEISDIVSAFF